MWGRVARRWEELEQRQEQRWAAVTATLECIVDNVQELLDGLVPEEKEKGKEKGVETDAEEMEMEEMEEVEEVEELGETGAGMEKDGSVERISELSCSWSMMTIAQRTGYRSSVAWSETEICS